jgi:hypothetical protein
MEYRHNTGQNGTIVNAASGTLLRTRVLVMPICGTAAGADTLIEGGNA